MPRRVRLTDQSPLRGVRFERFDTGIASAINLAGAFDHEFTQTPLAKHALL
jgi:hypothetical protein